MSFDFQSSITCIQWEEPLFRSADVTNLMYTVSVSGDNLLALNHTTNESNFCLEITLCQEYNVTVTPFSTFPDYIGARSTVSRTVPGGIVHFKCHVSDVQTFLFTVKNGILC